MDIMYIMYSIKYPLTRLSHTKDFSSLKTKIFYFFKKILLFIFREREGREKERERNINVWLPLIYPLLGTWPATPGMCPDWESNQ